MATIGLTVSLGVWQLRRADHKQALAEQLAHQQAAEVVQNSGWPCAGARESAKWAQRPVQLTGIWLPQHTVYLDNRQMSGQPGFFVVTPFKLHPAPGCGGDVVLVQRGWVPRHTQDRTFLSPIPAEPGVVQVQGRWMGTVHQVYALGEEGSLKPNVRGPIVRQNMDIRTWQQWLPDVAWLHGVVLQTAPSQTQGDAAPLAPGEVPLKRDWPAPDTGVDKHHAYAAQWFALAFTITGLYVWFQLIRSRRIR